MLSLAPGECRAPQGAGEGRQLRSALRPRGERLPRAAHLPSPRPHQHRRLYSVGSLSHSRLLHWASQRYRTCWRKWSSTPCPAWRWSGSPAPALRCDAFMPLGEETCCFSLFFHWGSSTLSRAALPRFTPTQGVLERAPIDARLHQAGQAHQVRRLLPRPRRSLPRAGRPPAKRFLPSFAFRALAGSTVRLAASHTRLSLFLLFCRPAAESPPWASRTPPASPPRPPPRPSASLTTTSRP